MMPPDPNKVFEVSISSYIKVDYKGDRESILEKGGFRSRVDSI